MWTAVSPFSPQPVAKDITTSWTIPLLQIPWCGPLRPWRRARDPVSNALRQDCPVLAHRTGAPSVVFAAMPSGLAVRFVLVCFLLSSRLGLCQCSLPGTLATSDDLEIPQLIRNIDVSLRLLLDNTRVVVDRVVPGTQPTAEKHDALQHLRMHVDHRVGQAECRVDEQIQQAESRLTSRLNSIQDELALLKGLLHDVLSGHVDRSHAIAHAPFFSSSPAPTPPYRFSPPHSPSPPSDSVSRPPPPLMSLLAPHPPIASTSPNTIALCLHHHLDHLLSPLTHRHCQLLLLLPPPGTLPLLRLPCPVQRPPLSILLHKYFRL